MSDEIEKLFPDTATVAAIGIETYLRWASSSESSSQVLELPPIQRGFVWKPKQIQDLWDSLLRGMPIGSVLLKTFNSGEDSAPLNPRDRKTEKSRKNGFHLMDGQQRTLTMLLGFQKFEERKHKLWIDFEEQGKNGSLFQIRVSTESQPFGYNSSGGKFSLHERRVASNQWFAKHNQQGKSNADLFQDESVRPWKANGKYDYMFEIYTLWNEESQEWSHLNRIIESEKNDMDSINKRICLFRKALSNLKQQWLALIKIPDTEVQHDLDDPSHDYLTMLFDRISSGGTRLSPDDLLFSMIKQAWPDAHNIVYHLQAKDGIGLLMKPTDFVMTAFRLALLESNNSAIHDLDLNARTFHRHLKDLLGVNGDSGKLREYIEGDTLVKAFKTFISLIEYDPTKNKNGIPKIMFPYLNVSMIQSVLYWILLNKESSELLMGSKTEVTRFVLFWLLCSGDSTSSIKASKIAIKEIEEKKGFPGVEIYTKLTAEDEYGNFLFSPLKKINYEKSKFEVDTFRERHVRAIHFLGEKFSDLYNNFCSKRMLLLWLQREWIEAKFPDASFSPIAGQDEDNVPYDFDHLVPQSSWHNLRGISTAEVKNNNNIFTNSYHRRAIGNSIGNYRVMCSSENRSRQDESLQDGLLKREGEWDSYSFYPKDEGTLEKWGKASPRRDVAASWSDERLLAFQYAVESRTLTLYRRYFDEAGFSKYCLLG